MFTNKHNSPEKPPKRLFGMIMGRLKLEKSLKIFKEKFSVSLTALMISAVLIIASFILFHSELSESESASFLSLIFSDTFAVILYYQYFALAVLESMPIVSINASLAAILLLMIALRLAIRYYSKISTLNKLINPPSHKATDGK
ncbi:MAG: hypothetical protein HYW79_01365 [Parcubacteria group bacterium]|nr:hypothetical protein [Parcubacteria group bacterium]